jgi:hypothetical protein
MKTGKQIMVIKNFHSKKEMEQEENDFVKSKAPVINLKQAFELAKKRDVLVLQ